ncbi:aminotransferase class I/II-fold pyridoxal phosphate-dependent enzyme [Neobacillus sp. MER 74]|uniref:pyridoxal phosphate-dependent aminotransferase n=1 Tax=Neobacillus sp. MER 74 TaxID=2939566 RepID=UPI00203E1930|nr:histidinol-phosphate transaminase [Neobacillus sp. MER 74]MCM3115372.1 aminotransferase class I/II-fold pyridoxal phosphate-dependent enzyme [Neobacillus sp. MER 74]
MDGLDPEQYVVANGADNIIKLIGNAYINPSDEVVYCTPTFTAYKSIVLLMGGIPVEVPSCANYDIDLEAMYNAINEKTKLVVIVNPNNPTGTIANKEELRSFLNRIPEHVIVVLDEAYIDYVETKDYPTGIDFIKEGFSVISIRTFSKLYGLAGIRVGYAVASKELLLPVQRVREVFSCNRVASAGAIAALEDKEHKLKVLKENKSEKVRLVEGLRRLGYEVTNSYTNFLFVNMLRDTTEISTTLFRMGLIIRPCAPWGLSTHARITVGTKEQNDKLIYALQNLDEAAVKGC